MKGQGRGGGRIPNRLKVFLFAVRPCGNLPSCWRTRPQRRYGAWLGNRFQKTVTMSSITPEWLFVQGGTEPCGTVEWNQPLADHGPGVYIVTVAAPPANGQHVVYIGRTKSLFRRLRQFYRHKYGASAPHRGGQDILKLDGPRKVHWARTQAYAEAERLMLEVFRKRTGTWPYGNRVRSARMSPAFR